MQGITNCDPSYQNNRRRMFLLAPIAVCGHSVSMDIENAIRHRLRTVALLAACMPLLAGCLAFYPVTDYAVKSEGGRVLVSNCLGKQSWRHDPEGVFLMASLENSRASDLPATLYWSISPKPGQLVRIPVPELRVRPLNGGDAVVKQIAEWSRTELQSVGSNRLERVVAERLPGMGPVLGSANTVSWGKGRPSGNKIFAATVRLTDLPDDGYVIEFPALEIDGKIHTLPPVEFKRRVYVEFMVPINC